MYVCVHMGVWWIKEKTYKIFLKNFNVQIYNFYFIKLSEKFAEKLHYLFL